MNNLSPHVQVNPFKDRICKVFSSSKDGELTFEDFLDMMSVFSENVSYNNVLIMYADICCIVHRALIYDSYTNLLVLL